jgi:hypothetical protein
MTVPRQQSQHPTSMRYQRVQAILEAERFFDGKLGPKTHSVDSRSAGKTYFSEEIIKITEALHAQGIDAYKAKKVDVLNMAVKVLRLRSNGAPSKAPDKAPKKTPEKPNKPPEKPKTQAALKDKAKPGKPKPTIKTPVKTGKPKKPPPAEPVPKPKPEPKLEPRAEIHVSESVIIQEPKVEPRPGVTPLLPPLPADLEEPVPIPESELPPERQPIRLPPHFDFSKYPHYSVQSTLYSLALSMLNMSEAYEKYEGFEERQKLIEKLILTYQDTCDQLVIKIQ